MRLAPILFAAVLCACASDDDERHAGTGTLDGDLEGLPLACSNCVSIARSFPPGTELKISPSGVACEAVQAGDRLTIDLGDARPGTYTVVIGYPSKAGLSRDQARAHACSAKEGSQAPCHDLVRSGTVTVTRYDAEVGGRVEGSFEITFADGALSGTFSAYRCD